MTNSTDGGSQDNPEPETPGAAPEAAANDSHETQAAKPAGKLVVVKKYANRRLYNTESSSYITLDTLADMIREGRDFVVYDAKTNDDITRGVLTQIIVEEENKGRALLPTSFLRQLIGFYGDSVQGLIPRYLEQAMSSFARQQQGVRQAMEKSLAPFIPFPIEEVSRQNMAMMERAMTLFSPFGLREPGAERPTPAQTEAEVPPDAELAAMRAEIESLKRELEGDAGGQRGGRHGGAPTGFPRRHVQRAGEASGRAAAEGALTGAGSGCRLDPRRVEAVAAALGHQQARVGRVRLDLLAEAVDVRLQRVGSSPPRCIPRPRSAAPDAPPAGCPRDTGTSGSPPPSPSAGCGGCAAAPATAWPPGGTCRVRW